MKKIFFYSEDLSYPFDEGIKKTARNILFTLRQGFDTLSCSKYNNNKQLEGSYTIKSNSLLICSKIKSIIQDFKPDVIIYLPSSSGTFASFIRMKVLSLFYHKAKTIMIILQNKHLSNKKRKLVGIMRPNCILTPIPQIEKTLKFLNSQIVQLPLYVDKIQFSPVYDNEVKKKIRRKYKLPETKYIVSHIGHINWGRNLTALIPLQTGNIQVVIISSSSTPLDAPKNEELKNKLIDSGIVIIDEYLPNIEEIYQLSDLYVFPIEYYLGSISLPLSILEARACGIPVLTTDFGSIRKFLGSDNNSIFYCETKNFKNKIDEIIKLKADFRITNIENLNNDFKTTLFSATV